MIQNGTLHLYDLKEHEISVFYSRLKLFVDSCCLGKPDVYWLNSAVEELNLRATVDFDPYVHARRALEWGKAAYKVYKDNPCTPDNIPWS